MSNTKVHILGVDFTNIEMNEVKDKFSKHNFNIKQFIVTANPELVMHAHKSEGYLADLIMADYILPDGIGVVWASRLMNQPLSERVAGFDLMIHLLNIADSRGLSCFFMGGTSEVNQKAVKHVGAVYSNLKIVGQIDGFQDLDSEFLIKDIQQKKPDLIFVALGVPKQEKWISMHYHNFDHGLFMGVGGSFDVLAGKTKRAPGIWIKLNLEWLYRIVSEPVRLKRLPNLFRFVFYIMCAIFRKKIDDTFK